MAFSIILETAHGSHFWSVPSEFLIFWSPGADIQDLVGLAGRDGV